MNTPDPFYDSELDDHAETFAAARRALREPFARLLAAALETIHAGRKIMFFGNGGSASDAQHLATELAVRYRLDRAPIAGLALTTDASSLTATGNDMGFDEIFARQISALGHAGDLAIGISTSGNSENVIRALRTARSMGIGAAGLSGRDGGRMVGVADPLLIVPSDNTARIQEMHITYGHLLCASLERELGLL
ncbi:MAG: SIS domain-containing protein [Rhodobacterales bacterium]|nr:SIS domain-containing protein [Rhodobacterales bacterium]